jgi:hypothetical protein
MGSSVIEMLVVNVIVWHPLPRGYPLAAGFLFAPRPPKKQCTGPMRVRRFSFAAPIGILRPMFMRFPSSPGVGDVHVYDDTGHKVLFQWDGICWNRMDDTPRPAARTGPKGPRITTKTQEIVQPAEEAPAPVVDSAPETDPPAATTPSS